MHRRAPFFFAARSNYCRLCFEVDHLIQTPWEDRTSLQENISFSYIGQIIGPSKAERKRFGVQKSSQAHTVTRRYSTENQGHQVTTLSLYRADSTAAKRPSERLDKDSNPVQIVEEAVRLFGSLICCKVFRCAAEN